MLFEAAMFAISIFNNKGGVGKTTLSFHFAQALAELNKKVLVVDLDPQCNFTIMSMRDVDFFGVWDGEDKYIADFGVFTDESADQRARILSVTRTIHFLLKATEDGQSDFDEVPPPFHVSENISLLPGRLTLHSYEDKIGERWSNAYKGDPLAVRTITQIRTIAAKYAEKYGYDFVLYDTSPSLGMLNRVILSMADGFIIPCFPDKFSLYGIKNIGNALKRWKAEFDTIVGLQAASRRNLFPGRFVRFLGYTIYNARPYRQNPPLNKWDLATGHFNFANKISETIRLSIPEDIRDGLDSNEVDEPIGSTAVMHTHNTMPAMAQKYHCPIWKLPDHPALDASDRNTLRVNRASYEETRGKYKAFAGSVIGRIKV